MRVPRLRRSPRSLLVTAVLAVLTLGVSGTAHAEYPENFNFFAGIPFELANPGGDMPGSNDWSCKPTREHPDPVVLVHGTAGGAQTNWGAYIPMLANAGYCVYTLTYGQLDVPWPLSAMGGMKTIEAEGAELANFVTRVRAATGAAMVDLIAHSQGTIVGNYYIKRAGGSGQVNKFVAISAPWLGTYGDQMNIIRRFAKELGAGDVDALAVGTGICPACSEMVGGSAFIAALNSDGVYDPTVSYTNIDTIYDELIVPVSIGLVPAPNATNILVQDGCSTDFSDHLAIAGSHRVAMWALNALDPAHPRTVSCEFIPPFTG
ncbi:lipase [Nocardia sp. SYP-A9097]|uniref:esterase/lipase family protein n=1 Tax=Nocardia sp. SYP-A9097 TaxID=2663237 RepID=UPI00129BA981|nr:alpha/beta fold hydrolase [Nocardia sp. SYP-A9097]MRH90415.1 lipase [Nocardia sp. SYP-A9097]